MQVGTKPLTLFGDPIFENAKEQIEECLEDDHATAGALMADHHLGYAMPIGGVIAYEDAISPTGVGFDIACGNMAVQTDILIGDLGPVTDKAVKTIMREIQRKVAFGMGRKNETPVDHPLFDIDTWPKLQNLFEVDIKKLAADQLGTVGSGNHYVDLLVGTNGHIWVANHFGSRGLGHKTATAFMDLAPKPDNYVRDKTSLVIPTDTDLGQFYVEAMHLAGEYAYAGREYVIGQVLQILGNPNVVQSVHNHHNFAWYENGQWVVRKGATPLTARPAFIGGSMGDPSVIVRGLLEPKSDPTNIDVVFDIGNLGSAPHGAGRVMSRNEAAGKVRKFWICGNRNCSFTSIRCNSDQSGYPSNHCPECGIPLRRERLRDTSSAKVDWSAEREKLNQRGIVVLGAGADESPAVYKTLEDVIGHHSNIQVIEVLEPLGVVMAGDDVHDPYKD